MAIADLDYCSGFGGVIESDKSDLDGDTAYNADFGVCLGPEVAAAAGGFFARRYYDDLLAGAS